VSERDNEKAIFNLPIAFNDQDVTVVDEDYVKEFCATIKYSYKA